MDDDSGILKDDNRHRPPNIVSRSEHNISRSRISENALKVLYRLKNSGFDAYLVGGGVRDLLLGRAPKDFDIATNAMPEEVKALFRNCRLIGRRFRLAHVQFGREIIEVATFRAAALDDEDGDREIENGRILRDNIYGSLDEDAWRRDFTVNALYYNISDFSVVDYTGGLKDLNEATLRLIGDPHRRYREDPVRMLRAVRFSVKLGFTVETQCEALIPELGALLEDIPPARLFDEVLKLFLSGHAVNAFDALRQWGLFRYLFPDTDALIEKDQDDKIARMIRVALENTDQRIQEEKPVTPAFLLAALLWPCFVQQLEAKARLPNMNDTQRGHLAFDDTMRAQLQRVMIPKRFAIAMKEIWLFQSRLKQQTPKRVRKLFEHPRFRAAYDFLLIRKAVEPELEELANWWTDYQEANGDQRDALLQKAVKSSAKRSKRGRYRNKKRGKSKEG